MCLIVLHLLTMWCYRSRLVRSDDYYVVIRYYEQYPKPLVLARSTVLGVRYESEAWFYFLAFGFHDEKIVLLL